MNLSIPLTQIIPAKVIGNSNHMSASTTPPQSPRLPAPSYPHDKGRFKIILAYWAVLIAAAPVWWILTAVQRLPLPDAQVREAASHSVSLAPSVVDCN